jgi:membrane dipeptidase
MAARAEAAAKLAGRRSPDRVRPLDDRTALPWWLMLSHADALHERAWVLLCHDHLWQPNDFTNALHGGVTARVVQPFIDVEVWGGSDAFEVTKHQEEGVARRAMVAFDQVLSYVESHPDQTLLVRSQLDLEEAKRSGRAAVILGSEGGRILEGSLELLRCYFRMGLRQIQLNWDFPNRIAACQNQTGDDDTGLTEFGHALIPEMNRLGMLIDTSHSSHRTRLEAFKLSRHPVTHGHAGAKSITDRPQNLTDDELKALADNGGVIGLHFFSRLVNMRGPDAGQATLDDLAAHIEHIREVVGIQSIALGPDWFPFHPFGGWTREQGFNFVRDLESIDRLPNFTRGLLQRGLSEADVEAILGGNMLRVLRAVLPAA